MFAVLQKIPNHTTLAVASLQASRAHLLLPVAPTVEGSRHEGHFGCDRWSTRPWHVLWPRSWLALVPAALGTIPRLSRALKFYGLLFAKMLRGATASLRLGWWCLEDH